MNAMDLTKRAPRSARVRLGGYAVLPRVIDKCRAAIAGQNGEYNFNCPLDQRFFAHFGMDAEAFKRFVATGVGDGAIMNWVSENATLHKSQPDIMGWTLWQETRAPGDLEGREYFHNVQKKSGPDREDIQTWFDLLDLDDYVSFGGQA
jgi:Domain of unknown function (DUF5069)